MPVKRTALGRFKHEGATVALATDGRVVVYLGDDERFEYIYKFVSSGRYAPGDRAANRDLLDDGTLYVARFDADGRGDLAAAGPRSGCVDDRGGFMSQADVLIRARTPRTRSARRRWTAPNGSPCLRSTATSTARSPTTTSAAAADRPAADAANPRADNVFGHIMRWNEAGDDPARLPFRWDIFAQCGDPAIADAAKRGNISGDAYGSPDGLWFDPRGLLWIQTDVSTTFSARATTRASATT